MVAKTISANKKLSENSEYILFFKDYFSLVKPKVMTLVVFTAFVSIFVAPVSIHPWIAFVSIFCIALGSGAAGAFNMWYESDLDLMGYQLGKWRVCHESGLDWMCNRLRN